MNTVIGYKNLKKSIVTGICYQNQNQKIILIFIKNPNQNGKKTLRFQDLKIFIYIYINLPC